MAFLPPTAEGSSLLQQVSSLYTILTDPDKYQALMDSLIEKSKELDDKDAYVTKAFEDYKAVLADLEKREAAIKQTKADIDTINVNVDDKLAMQAKKESDFAVTMSAFKQESADTESKLKSMSDSLNIREQAVSSKEASLTDLINQQNQALSEATALKVDYTDKLNKLRSLIS